MRLFDSSHKIFKPLITRVLITVFCLGWALFEWSHGAKIWALLAGAMGVAAGYEFFLNKNNDFSTTPRDKQMGKDE